MVMCTWVLIHFFSKRSVITFRFRYMKLELPVIRSIIAIGMAPFAMQLASSVVQAILNTQLVSYGGDIAIAANGIIMGVMQMIVMCIIAVNMATQPIIGFNYGAKNFARVRETLFRALWIASAISVGGVLVVEFLPGILVKLFNHDDPELYRIGVRGMRLGMMMTFLIGFQVVVGNYFQSTGKARLAMVISLLRQVIVLVPILLILPPIIGLDGVWLSIPVADTVSAMVVAYFFNKERLRLNELVASGDKLL
jgi:Na+-driven multidrug efflux pump